MLSESIKEKQRIKPLWLLILVLSLVTMILGLIGILFRFGFYYVMGDTINTFLSFCLYAILVIVFCIMMKKIIKINDRTILFLVIISYWLFSMYYLANTTFTKYFEIDQVVRAAKEIAQYGSIVNSPNFEEHLVYFSYYHNVWNTAQSLSIICKMITFFGLEQHMDFALPAVITTFNIITGIPCIYSIVRYFTNNRSASLFAVFLYIIYPAVLINSIVPYHFTEVFSLPVIVLFLFIQLERSPQIKPNRKWLIIVLIAILTGVGVYICYTPIIPIISIMIVCILAKKLQIKSLISLVLSVAVACSLFYVSNSLYKKEIYRDDYYDMYHLPTELFVYLALVPNGAGVFAQSSDWMAKYYTYQSEQLNGLRDQPGSFLESRVRFIRDLIRKEVSSYNIFSISKHFAIKIAAEFDLGSFYGQGPGYTVYDTTRTDSGEEVFPFHFLRSIGYDSLCQGIYCLILLLGLFSFGFIKKHENKLIYVLPLSIVGANFATLLNETSPRHIYLFLPYFIILASFGYYSTINYIALKMTLKNVKAEDSLS